MFHQVMRIDLFNIAAEAFVASVFGEDFLNKVGASVPALFIDNSFV